MAIDHDEIPLNSLPEDYNDDNEYFYDNPIPRARTALFGCLLTAAAVGLGALVYYRSRFIWN